MAWKQSSILWVVFLLATAANAQYEESTAPADISGDSVYSIEAEPETGSNVYSNKARTEYFAQPLQGMRPDSQALKKKADALNYSEDKNKKPKDPETLPEGYKFKGFGAISRESMRVLAYGLAFAALAFLVYYLLSLRLGQREKTEALARVGMAEITNAENLEKLQVDELLDQALAAGNLKLAVRLLYLKILKELFLKGWVRPSAEKTNLDYLRELSGTEFRQGFMETTGYFEKVFYGDFALERKSYDQLSGRFYSLFHAIRLK